MNKPNPGSRQALAILVTAVLLTGCSGSAQAGGSEGEKASAPKPEHTETAIFAGGCFWCSESDFEKVPGVVDVVSGYIGGHVDNPSYRQVSNGGTGHAESVRVEFDPSVISYGELLQVYWHSVDPTVKDRQFCDWGNQYRTGIFYLDETQEKAARASLEALDESKPFPEPIVTEITKATTFYPAEEYHQDYYKKNPAHYHRYRNGCGRDQRLKELWGEKR